MEQQKTAYCKVRALVGHSSAFCAEGAWEGIPRTATNPTSRLQIEDGSSKLVNGLWHLQPAQRKAPVARSGDWRTQRPRKGTVWGQEPPGSKGTPAPFSYVRTCPVTFFAGPAHCKPMLKKSTIPVKARKSHEDTYQVQGVVANQDCKIRNLQVPKPVPKPLRFAGNHLFAPQLPFKVQ